MVAVVTVPARAAHPAPAPLPSAADLPAAPLALLEVVGHPRGGWTVAVPVDASRTTARIYAGNFATRTAARAALKRFMPC